MKKVYSLISIMMIAVLAITTIGGSSAQASVPRFSFQTEDGKWDGEVGNPNKLANIEIDLVSPIYLKTASGTTPLSNYSKLSVRLRMQIRVLLRVIIRLRIAKPCLPL